MNIGRKIDECATKATTPTDDEAKTQEKAGKQAEGTDNAKSPLPYFSKITTDVEDNPYLRRPPFIPPKTTIHSSWIIHAK